MLQLEAVQIQGSTDIIGQIMLHKPLRDGVVFHRATKEPIMGIMGCFGIISRKQFPRFEQIRT